MTKFIKDISYLPAHLAGNVNAIRNFISATSTDPGTYLQFVTVLLQQKNGAQLWVSKEVSDDLQAADIDIEEIKFDDVDWPHDRLEVYFQDPQLPTLLASRFTNNTLRAEIEQIARAKLPDVRSAKVDPDALLLHVQAELSTGEVAFLTHTTYDVDKFAAGSDLQDVSEYHTAWSVAMNQDEQTQLRRMTVLFYKVLLLAGSEGHSIRRTRQQPTRAEGGKAGFKNRPSHERLIVEYLPKHRQERWAESMGGKHQFLGRRGHWRRFRSARFTKKQGMRIFIYPVNGPDGLPPKRKFILKTQ